MVYDINCIIDFKYCYDNNNAIINIIGHRTRTNQSFKIYVICMDTIVKGIMGTEEIFS